MYITRDEVIAKYDRAAMRFSNFLSSGDEFLQANSNGIEECQTETNGTYRRDYSIGPFPSVPPEVRIDYGEFVGQLCSIFDSVFNALLIRYWNSNIQPPPVGNQRNFPVFPLTDANGTSLGKFEKWERKMSGQNPSILKAIRLMQPPQIPVNGKCHPMLALKSLWNIDKHNVPIHIAGFGKSVTVRSKQKFSFGGFGNNLRMSTSISGGSVDMVDTSMNQTIRFPNMQLTTGEDIIEKRIFATGTTNDPSEFDQIELSIGIGFAFDKHLEYIGGLDAEKTGKCLLAFIEEDFLPTFLWRL